MNSERRHRRAARRSPPWKAARIRVSPAAVTILAAVAPLVLFAACSSDASREAPPADPAAESAAESAAAESTAESAAGGDLATRIQGRLGAIEAEYGVAYRNLGSGDEILLNPDEEFHAASMMKVPVMVRLYRMADAGVLDLDAPLAVRNEFISIYDGTVYSLTMDDDSDSTLYALVGDSMPTRELIDLMIKRSSNLATNILIELADPDSIAAMLDGFGAQGMQVLRGVEDIPAYRNGMNNTTSARGLLELYTALGRGEAASPASTTEMLDILLGQEFNDAIPAGLPADVPVAHKTGWIPEIDHDGGIVYPPSGPPYVLVILTRGVEDAAVSRHAAADVSRMIWESLHLD